MNVFNLCLFSLLILGASVQVKGARDRKHANQETINQAIKSAGNYVDKLFYNRRDKLVNKFSTETASLYEKNDHCSIQKAKKVESLQEQLKELNSCNIIEEAANAIVAIVEDSASLVLGVVGTFIGFTTGIAGCIVSNPVSIPCYLTVAVSSLQELATIIPAAIQLAVQVGAIGVQIVTDVLKCLHVQKIFENKFDVILKTAC